METALKIQQLWRYLKIQDDEILIVQLYNQIKGSDEFLITEIVDKRLVTRTINSLQMLTTTKPFRLVQQLDYSGKHIIPLVEQLKRDEFVDY